MYQEAIVSKSTGEFTKEASPPSFWDQALGWIGNTVGTYANAQRDSFFAREGIAKGSPNDKVVKDSNAKGDIAGRVQTATGIDITNPWVIGGAVLAVGAIAFFALRK